MKTTSESRRCFNINTRSESRHRKHNVVTMLVFGNSNDAGNTTLWQRYPTSRPKYNQNLTLLQRSVPAAYCWLFSYQCRLGSTTIFILKAKYILNPLSANFTKWSNTQTICWQIADKLFKCVWPFCGIGT